jgi:hypothetical protein
MLTLLNYTLSIRTYLTLGYLVFPTKSWKKFGSGSSGLGEENYGRPILLDVGLRFFLVTQLWVYFQYLQSPT